MTYEEAIEILQEEHDYCQEMSYVIKALEMAIEALEKRIPKKPIERYADYDDTEAGLCPFCNEGVDEEMNFCSYCGQVIDWED